VYVESIYDGDTSRKDPFDQSRELSYAPAVIRVAMESGGLRVRVIKIRLRLARLSNGWILDREMVGALNVGLRALASNGRGVASPSTEPHAVWAKLVSPHRGLAQTTEIRLTKSVRNTVVWETLAPSSRSISIIYTWLIQTTIPPSSVPASNIE